MYICISFYLHKMTCNIHVYENLYIYIYIYTHLHIITNTIDGDIYFRFSGTQYFVFFIITIWFNRSFVFTCIHNWRWSITDINFMYEFPVHNHCNLLRTLIFPWQLFTRCKFMENFSHLFWWVCNLRYKASFVYYIDYFKIL